MFGTGRIWRKPALSLALVASAAGLLAGCAGTTTVTSPPNVGAYSVAVRLDPITLNPPALGTLSYSITNQAGKPVTSFEPVNDELMQTVILKSDLSYFRHSTTDRVVVDSVSVPASFPTSGTYYVWSYFKPAKDQVQVYTTTVTTGQASSGPQLTGVVAVPNASPTAQSRSASGVSVTLLPDATSWHAGKAAQMAFRVTERGYPVTSLESYFGAPGQLWIADAVPDGIPTLAHEVGTGFAHVNTSSAPATGDQNNTASQFPNSGQIGGSPANAPQAQVTAQPPNIDPGLANAIVSATAQPVSTLLPVQQTAQSSVIGTPGVIPAIGYGPEIVFSHTFPHAGLYRMWVEMSYGSQVVTTDFTVNISQ